nr:MAG: hypothetical protein [Bacteriophage sp.]
MEKPTYTAIDYNSKENKVIEERIRNYYLPVKNVLETVRDRRINIPDSPRGLCADLMDVSRTISREFALVEEVFLWRHVIKLWFTPQRFNIEIVYFGYYNPTIIKLQGEGLRIEGGIWYRIPLENLEGIHVLLGTAFWFPTSKAYNNRIKILECALEDLAKLTKEEEAILRLTEEIWNRFLELPINHPMEANEIAMKIHDIQRMIISRPGFRMNQEMFRQYGNGNCNKG